MSKKINFAGISKKFSQGLSTAGAAYVAGTSGVSVSPGQLAAQQRDKWLANTTQAADRWADSLNNMSLSQWQQRCATVGSQRLQTSGASAAQKIDAYYASKGSQIQSLVDQ